MKTIKTFAKELQRFNEATGSDYTIVPRRSAKHILVNGKPAHELRGPIADVYEVMITAAEVKIEG